MKSYLIIGGQRNGKYIETDGALFLKLPRQMTTEITYPLEQIQKLTFKTEDYILSKFNFDNLRFIECYRLIGMSDDDASIALLKIMTKYA